MLKQLCVLVFILIIFFHLLVDQYLELFYHRIVCDLFTKSSKLRFNRQKLNTNTIPVASINFNSEEAEPESCTLQEPVEPEPKPAKPKLKPVVGIYEKLIEKLTFFDRERTEFKYDTMRHFLEKVLRLPKRKTFVDLASEYDPTNVYTRRIIGTKDHKVLCLHKKRLQNERSNANGLMCKGGILPVKMDGTKRKCRQLDAIFSKNVAKSTENYVYQYLKKKFILNKKWNDGTSSPSLNDKTCIILGSSGVVKSFPPNFKKYMDRSDVVFFHVNHHNYENGYRKLQIIGKNETLRPCYRTHSCGYFLRYVSGKQDYYRGSFPDTCGLNNLVFRTVSSETCTAVPPRIPSKWPPGANFSTISVDALQVFLARRIATNVYDSHLSSGTLIALRAFKSCKNVHVYGMFGLEKDVYGNNLPYSFNGYENNKIFLNKKCGSCALDVKFFSFLNYCFKNFNYYV